jgi:hypothetical protein
MDSESISRHGPGAAGIFVKARDVAVDESAIIDSK